MDAPNADVNIVNFLSDSYYLLVAEGMRVACLRFLLLMTQCSLEHNAASACHAWASDFVFRFLFLATQPGALQWHGWRPVGRS